MQNTPSSVPSKNFCYRHKNKFWFLAVAIIVITSATSYQNSMPKNTITDSMMSSMMISDHAMTSGSASMTPAKMELHGYQKYSPELVRSALNGDQKVVLFFAASWCPTCKALGTEIMTHLALIPSDTLIVLVNYDDATELKQQYGVTTQHTTVMLNSDGTLQSKKLGARTISEVLGQ